MSLFKLVLSKLNWEVEIMAGVKSRGKVETTMINYVEIFRNGKIQLTDAYKDVVNILNRDDVEDNLNRKDREGYIKQMHFLEGCIAIKFMKENGYIIDSSSKVKEWKKK